VVVDRGRKYFDLRERPQIEKGRPASDRLSVAVETPHETGLRAAMYAARVE
jgi:hypothetical protein